MDVDVVPDLMASTLVFIGHRKQIDEWAAVASRLWDIEGWTSHMWVVDEYDRRAALETGVFARVVHLLAGFQRQEANWDAYQVALRQLAALEAEDGTAWFHEDAASDRSLTGATDPGVALHRITSRWSRIDIACMASRIHDAVIREAGAAQPLAVIGETNTLPYRIVHRSVVRAGALHLRPESPGHLDGRVHFESHLQSRWTWAVDLYHSFRAGEPIPKDARQFAENRLSDIRELHIKPNYSVGMPRGTRRLWERLRLATAKSSLDAWRTARERDSINSPRGVPQEVVSPAEKVRRAVALEFRRRYYERVVTRSIPSERYAAYFFHVQPEFTVEHLGFAFQDQVAHVRNLVAALPADVALVVKEHRPMAGTRPLDYYAELSSIPNVVILCDSIDSIDIIKASEVVFTLTGTVALEAMAVGRPAVLFGDIYYDQFDGVYRATSLPDLKTLLHPSIALRAASTDEAVRALAARYAASYPGSWPTCPSDGDGVERLANALVVDLRRRGALAVRS